MADEEDSDTKRCRSSGKIHEIGIDNVKPKLEQNDGARSNGNDEQKQRKAGNDKPSEPPKDYIHVRARRGQATDSHSLAERVCDECYLEIQMLAFVSVDDSDHSSTVHQVRREKISQRMKLLQDLVPGCSKVTLDLKDALVTLFQLMNRTPETRSTLACLEIQSQTAIFCCR